MINKQELKSACNMILHSRVNDVFVCNDCILHKELDIWTYASDIQAQQGRSNGGVYRYLYPQNQPK